MPFHTLLTSGCSFALFLAFFLVHCYPLPQYIQPARAWFLKLKSQEQQKPGEVENSLQSALDDPLWTGMDGGKIVSMDSTMPPVPPTSFPCVSPAKIGRRKMAAGGAKSAAEEQTTTPATMAMVSTTAVASTATTTTSGIGTATAGGNAEMDGGERKGADGEAVTEMTTAVLARPGGTWPAHSELDEQWSAGSSSTAPMPTTTTMMMMGMGTGKADR